MTAVLRVAVEVAGWVVMGLGACVLLLAGSLLIGLAIGQFLKAGQDRPTPRLHDPLIDRQRRIGAEYVRDHMPSTDVAWELVGILEATRDREAREHQSQPPD